MCYSVERGAMEVKGKRSHIYFSEVGVSYLRQMYDWEPGSDTGTYQKVSDTGEGGLSVVECWHEKRASMLPAKGPLSINNVHL